MAAPYWQLSWQTHVLERTTPTLRRQQATANSGYSGLLATVRKTGYEREASEIHGMDKVLITVSTVTGILFTSGWFFRGFRQVSLLRKRWSALVVAAAAGWRSAIPGCDIGHRRIFL